MTTFVLITVSFPSPQLFFFGQFWLTRALDCKYDNSYSTVGSKPLLGCFTRMFIVSAISNARDYSFNCFLKAGRVLVSEIVAGRLFQVHMDQRPHRPDRPF